MEDDDEELQPFVRAGDIVSPSRMFLAPFHTGRATPEFMKVLKFEAKLSELFKQPRSKDESCLPSSSPLAVGATVAVSLHSKHHTCARALVKTQPPSPEEKVEVFLVDSGRTLHVEPDRVLPLPAELSQESNSIKHLAFLFHLKDVSMFAQSEKNRLLAAELLRVAHRVWVEDTDLVPTADGRRRILTGRLLASYVTAAQIKELHVSCERLGVDCRQFWMNRLCINTVLNENIAGRRVAYKVETDSEGEEEEEEEGKEVNHIADVNNQEKSGVVQENAGKLPVDRRVVGGKSQRDLSNSELQTEDLGLDVSEVNPAPGDASTVPDEQETEPPVAAEPIKDLVNESAFQQLASAAEIKGKSRDVIGEKLLEQDLENLQPVKEQKGSYARLAKSYIVVPLSSDGEEEEDVSNQYAESPLTAALPKLTSSPLVRRPRGRPRKDPSALYPVVKMRPLSPGADDNQDSDADWYPSSPSPTRRRPLKRRGRRRGPGRPRKRFKEEEMFSDREEEEVTELNSRADDGRLAGQVGCNFADCGEMFGSLALLAAHLDSVHRESSILRCPICGKYFTLSPPYEQHMAENHFPRTVDQEEGEGAVVTALPILSPNYVIESQLVTCRLGLKDCQEQLGNFFGRDTFIFIRKMESQRIVAVSGVRCAVTDYRYITAAVDQAEMNRALWVNIRTFSPLPTGQEPLRTRLKLCLVSFSWRHRMEGDLEADEEEGDDVVASLVGARLERQPVAYRRPMRIRVSKTALLRVSLEGLKADDWERRVPRPNRHGIPANQTFYTRSNREEIRDILSESIGPLYYPGVLANSVENTTYSCSLVDVDGRKYRGSFCRYIRFQEQERRLNVAVTEYKKYKEEEEELKTEPTEASPPDFFSRVELFWTERRLVPDGRGIKRHCRISDLEVAVFQPMACVKRLSKSVTVQDLSGVPVMSAIVCDRLRIVAKYQSYVFRLSRSAQNSQNQRKRNRQAAAAAVLAAMVAGQEDDDKAKMAELGGGDGYKSAARVKRVNDELAKFSAWSSNMTPSIYTSRSGQGILMVISNKRLLSGMVGGSCSIVPGWQARRLQLGVLHPRLTNATVLVFAFHLPNIVHRGNGLRRPKLCLGVCALSSSCNFEDVSLVGEHMVYNHPNLSSVHSMSAASSDHFFAVQQGLQASSCVYVRDEMKKGQQLNTAINHLRTVTHILNDLERTVAEEMGVGRLSWEDYAEKVIRAKQEADMAEVILSPFEGEEFELSDPEGMRLFGLSVYERALLTQEELRRHEVEFLDWISYAAVPEQTWKEYVQQKVAAGSTSPAPRGLSADELAAWSNEKNLEETARIRPGATRGDLVADSKRAKILTHSVCKKQEPARLPLKKLVSRAYLVPQKDFPNLYVMETKRPTEELYQEVAVEEEQFFIPEIMHYQTVQPGEVVIAGMEHEGQVVMTTIDHGEMVIVAEEEEDQRDSMVMSAVEHEDVAERAGRGDMVMSAMQHAHVLIPEAGNEQVVMSTVGDMVVASTELAEEDLEVSAVGQSSVMVSSSTNQGKMVVANEDEVVMSAT